MKRKLMLYTPFGPKAQSSLATKEAEGQDRDEHGRYGSGGSSSAATESSNGKYSGTSDKVGKYEKAREAGLSHEAAVSAVALGQNVAVVRN